MLGLVALHLAAPFLPFSVAPAQALASLLVLLAGFRLMGGAFQKASLAFLALGAALLAGSRQPASAWAKAASSMSNIVAIVALMQSFSMPIRLGEYDRALRAWLERRVAGRGALFVLVTFVTNLLTSFLNLGSVPILVALFEDAIRRREPRYERFFAAALSRGYVLTALWSPGAVNLYLVAQVTGLSWSAVFLPGFVLAIAGMAMSCLLESGRGGILGGKAPAGGAAAADREAGRPGAAEARELPDAEAGPVFPLLLVAAAFVLATLGLELLGIGSSSNRILLAGLLVCAGWTALLSGRPGLGPLLRGQWEEGLLKAGEVGPFFVALGLFSGGLEGSGLLGLAAPALQAAARGLGGGAVVLIGALIVGGSLVGLHPFVSIALFGKLLVHAGLPLPPLTLALGLSVGGAAAYMVSPFAGVIMTISRLLGTRPFDLAFRWNWRFGALFFAFGMAFAFAWGAAFG